MGEVYEQVPLLGLADPAPPGELRQATAWADESGARGPFVAVAMAG